MPTEEIGGFKTPDARRVWQATLAVERMLLMTRGNPQEQRAEYIQFQNDSGETIPEYACMQITDVVETAGRHLFKVKKPILWDEGLIGPFLFNTAWTVEPDNFGTAQTGPIYRAIKDSAVDVPINVRIGPKNDSWKIDKGCMYSSIGLDTIAEDCVRFISNETPILGITDEEIPENGKGDVTKKDPTDDDWIAGSVVYEAYNPSDVAIPVDTLVMLFPVDAKWAAVAIC